MPSRGDCSKDTTFTDVRALQFFTCLKKMLPRIAVWHFGQCLVTRACFSAAGTGTPLSPRGDGARIRPPANLEYLCPKMRDSVPFRISCRKPQTLCRSQKCPRF